MIRAVIVNDRQPKHELGCPACGTRIANGYARDTGTRIMYCRFDCFAADEAISEGSLDAFRVAKLPSVMEASMSRAPA